MKRTRTATKTKPKRPRRTPVGPPNALDLAIAAHRRDDLDDAEARYRAILQQRPNDPDAMHFLAVLLHRRGQSDEAVAMLNAALAISNDYPDAHNNLGNIHKECGRLADAEACYLRALGSNPDHANAWSNLGVILEAQDRPQDAFAAYVQLVQHAPKSGRSYWMLGRFLMRHPKSRKHVEDAAECYRRALELDGPQDRILHNLGYVLYALDRPEEARQVYRQWLEREPDHPVPRHMLAASGGADIPARAADAYVRNEFDGFAASFDDQLVNRLHYRAPQVLTAAVLEGVPAGVADLAILDAGCGTGLCGPLLRPRAQRLVGVDLSEGMLERARRRDIYDELTCAELTAFISADRARWDVIVSADTLVYFGDLAPVSAAAHAALRQGGWFGFSLEAIDGDGFELSQSGRYRHGRGYVEGVLQRAGFQRIDIRSDSMRMERGQPVASWVVLAQRNPDGAQPEFTR